MKVSPSFLVWVEFDGDLMVGNNLEVPNPYFEPLIGPS